MFHVKHWLREKHKRLRLESQLLCPTLVGERDSNNADVRKPNEQPAKAARSLVADIKAAGAKRACVGLGVSTRAHVEEIGEYADGVIVGTALVKALASGGVDAVARLTRELAGRDA